MQKPETGKAAPGPSVSHVFPVPHTRVKRKRPPSSSPRIKVVKVVVRHVSRTPVLVSCVLVSCVLRQPFPIRHAAKEKRNPKQDSYAVVSPPVINPDPAGASSFFAIPGLCVLRFSHDFSHFPFPTSVFGRKCIAHVTRRRE